MSFKNIIILAISLIFFNAANLLATTYYVSPTGSNSSKGTSVSTPWGSLSYAESKLSEGDKVIVRGGVYREAIIIDVKNVTFENYPGELPVIDWNYEGPASGEKRDYTAVIAVIADGVIVNGFEISGSTGTGISVYGTSGGTANNVKIKNCKIHDTWYSCLRILDGADYCTVEDCEIYRGCYVMSNCSSPFNAPVCRDEGWGDPTQVMVNTCQYATFRRNIIRDSYNEGFNIDRNSKNATIEYCQIYGNSKLQLYICSSSNVTVRYNLIYGTTTNAGGRSGHGPGIYLNNEDQWGLPEVKNFWIYGNFIANTNCNLAVYSRYVDGKYYRVSNVFAYNNTLVEAIDATQNVVFSANVGSGHVFKNNIIWQTEGKIGYSPSTDKVTADYNLWSQAPNTPFQGSSDPNYSVPKLLKTKGWNSISGGELSVKDFELQSGSPAIDKGDVIDNVEFSNILETADSNLQTKTISLVDQSTQGTGWEIGADIFVVTPYKTDNQTPSPPTNFQIHF